jgi:putative oxidoreductase
MHSTLVFIGRILMGIFFIGGAIWHSTHWDIALAKTAATGVWRPDLILCVATVLMWVGSVSILLGIFTRIGALLLLIQMLITAFLFFPFWSLEAPERSIALMNFLIRIALCGGLFVLMGSGAGKVSIDSRCCKR